MKKILLTIFLIFSYVLIPTFIFAGYTDNLTDKAPNGRDDIWNDHLEEINDPSKFMSIGGNSWSEGIEKFVWVVARDLKNLVLILVTLIGTIMVIKLIFWNNTDEQQKKLKMWILWASIGIMVMQSAYVIYDTLFNKEDVNVSLATDFKTNIINPFTDVLYLLASFVFLAIMIYSFYRIVTANGDDSKVTTGKMTIFYAVIWFIVIKFADILVNKTLEIGWGGVFEWDNREDIKWNAEIIFKIIDWMTSFVAIIVVLMVIYAGFLIMTSGNDDDKKKKARGIILYIAIWLFVLVASYLILNFFPIFFIE